MVESMQIDVERFPIAGRFTIARGSKTEAVVVTVKLAASTDDGLMHGWGECVPYSRYGETVEGVVAALESVREAVLDGADRVDVQTFLPRGAARNALDCAFWDLEAKLSGVPASRRAEVGDLRSVTTAYTISLDTPSIMADNVLKAKGRPILKVKLGGPGGDLERIRAIRRVAPQVTLIADANEGWTEDNLDDHLLACAEARFALIEQPVPAARDELLRSRGPSPVPLCADESVRDRPSLVRLKGLYQVVNIKLDKTGGLTEALLMMREAEKLGFGVMIGCMVGTSLAMAPALILSDRARFIDLDGPLLLAHDRDNGLKYEGSVIFPPEPSLWG
jgi:L-alanine-DL-glutamate epimerase-like enolase superfamily enzyme